MSVSQFTDWGTARHVWRVLALGKCCLMAASAHMQQCHVRMPQCPWLTTQHFCCRHLNTDSAWTLQTPRRSISRQPMPLFVRCGTTDGIILPLHRPWLSITCWWQLTSCPMSLTLKIPIMLRPMAFLQPTCEPLLYYIMLPATRNHYLHHSCLAIPCMHPSLQEATSSAQCLIVLCLALCVLPPRPACMAYFCSLCMHKQQCTGSEMCVTAAAPGTTAIPMSHARSANSILQDFW